MSSDPPFLDKRRTIRVDEDIHLVSFVRGHPHLRDGARIVTSALQELSPDRSWARTRSRVYQLGAAGQGPLPAEWAEAVDRFLAALWGTKRSQEDPQ